MRKADTRIRFLAIGFRTVILGVATFIMARTSLAADVLTLENASIRLDECKSGTYYESGTERHFIPGCLEKQRQKLEGLVIKGGDPFWLEVIARDLLIFYYDAHIQAEPTPILVRSRFDVYVEALRRGDLAADQVASAKLADSDDTVRWMRDLAKDKAEGDFFSMLDQTKYKNEIKALNSDYKLHDRLLHPKAPSAWATVLLAAAQAANNTAYIPQPTSTSSAPPVAGVSTVNCSSDTPECEATGSQRHGRVH